MSNEELKSQVTTILPSASFEEGGGWLTANIDAAEWKNVANALRHTSGLEFDFLFCITCVDWKTHLSMVYHLTSSVHAHTIIIKATLDTSDPVIETVADIWRTAEFHEREAYDLFGVKFLHHPDLRRLFMTDDHNGWPLRKDYEDPVNMIKL